MLYTENLEEIIFERHNIIETDELIILSGYVGPKPIEKLRELPFQAKVIYGMYGSDGIERDLHNTLLTLQDTIPNIDIFYSNMPVHAKCYVWKNNGIITHALIGSANFSSKGLKSPNREVLGETTRDTFNPLNSYISRILNDSISCLEEPLLGTVQIQPYALGECLLSLVGRNGEVQNVAGLNWGQGTGTGNHTTRNDAYIKIRIEDVINFPNLFPPKSLAPLRADGRGRAHRQNDSIDIIWDDGTFMEGLFFGNQEINGIRYPKQVGSFPQYKEMGIYFRKRLGVPLGQPVRRHHLDRYGRIDVGVSLIGEGVYKFDFSV